MTDDENRNQHYLSRATKRLNRDMRLIREDPIPEIDVAQNKDDILDWHFAIHGKEGTPYQGGVYHGRFVFPPTFPFGPPKILFLTPNGRFRVKERICFSLSDFHPEEWKPAYSVTAVLRGVYDFMHEATDTTGSIDATDSERRRLARESMQHNRDNSSFCNFFPHLCSIEDATDEEKMDTGIEQNTMPPEADDIFNNPDQITNSPFETHNTSNFPNTDNSLPGYYYIYYYIYLFIFIYIYSIYINISGVAKGAMPPPPRNINWMSIQKSS